MSETNQYDSLLEKLTSYINESKIEAIRRINKQMIESYWYIGKTILAQQEEQGWGAKIIDKLAQDLRQRFPKMKGVSSRNLKYMRKFAQEYSDVKFVQQTVAQLSWGHNIQLIDKIKDKTLRFWYIQKTLPLPVSHRRVVCGTQTTALPLPASHRREFTYKFFISNKNHIFVKKILSLCLK